MESVTQGSGNSSPSHQAPPMPAKMSSEIPGTQSVCNGLVYIGYTSGRSYRPSHSLMLLSSAILLRFVATESSGIGGRLSAPCEPPVETYTLLRLRFGRFQKIGTLSGVTISCVPTQKKTWVEFLIVSSSAPRDSAHCQPIVA